MDEPIYTDPELQILTERCRKYQGTAKININQIVPHPAVLQHIDPKNVERLSAGVNTTDLLTDQPSRFPHLHFSIGSIKCLHGQHRLKAGEHYLPSVDQWWTVDLYLDDISRDLRSRLVDEYANERVPSDGEIYIKVRQYRNEANAHFENRWLARLSDNKARRLRGLESHPGIRAAFDSLLVLPSLLVHGMQIGSLPQALAICCDEEIVHSLTRLLQYWSSLVRHDRAKMLRIDTHTVQTLQLLAPGVSSKDRTTVKGFVHSGEVFSNFTESERSSIWKRLKKTKGIIPSLYTFFKDLWYLESCANCIKQLITPSRSFPTIRSAVRAAFSPFNPAHTEFLIQTSETGFRSYSPSQGDPAELGYRQLWLYAMCHYPKLSQRPQKKDLTAKTTREVVEPMVLYDMAILAKRLGFQSPQIEQLIRQSPDRKIARDALLKARRPDRYQYNEEEVETLINKVTECFLRASPLDHQLPVQSVGGRKTKKESRCGHPKTQAQLQDCQFLFLDQIHGDSIKEERKATSILVRRSVYFNFFSKLPRPSVNGDTISISPNLDLPMSPLFVPNNRSPQDEGAEEIGVAGTGAEQASSLERQRLKDARRQQKRAKKLRKRQEREQRRHQYSRANRYSTSSSRNLSTLPPQSGMGIDRINSECSGREDALELIAETKSGSSGRMSIIGGNEQCLSDTGPSAADELEHGEPIGEEQSCSGYEELESHAELGFEDEQPRGGGGRGEESITGRESLVDPNIANTGEHTSEQEDKATETAAPPSPMEEVQKALDTLEGRRRSRIESGPSTIIGRPYDPTQRRQQTPKMSIPPQETLEGDINALLQTAAQEQTPRPTTEINFLEAQHLPVSRMNEEQSSWSGVSQVGQARDRQQAGPEESLGSVEFDPQPEFPSSIDQSSRRHGTTKIQAGQEAPRSESVSPDASPHVQEATRQDNVTERSSSSPAQGSSTKTDARTQLNIARPKQSLGQQDRSPGRGEGGSDTTKRSEVTIMFRARDEQGEWNRLVQKLVVDRSDPSPVGRMAAKQARAQKATYYDQNLRQVPPGQCFDAAIADGTNTVFVTFGDVLTVNEETVDSITRALQADQ
ncbi:hypothetical protein N7492_009715 [Penicillium capsulatum]|uniref:Uncharacterized protein n=1 Tax=Penicillium capsulatum TaxID=69766 RepID=A0A9W9LFR8_9EURO|nr:hypothetical protein N7492_009715 [Penicillium capsulatum]KAJ6114205.1 hypothetical protein N7512_007650 [Penicillium capsulatum]